MTLNKVTLTGTYLDGNDTPLPGTVIFIPSVVLTDIADTKVILQVPVTVAVNSAGQFSVSLYATDNASLQPEGWTWQVTENVGGLPPSSWNFFLAYSDGSTQDISALTPVAEVTPAAAYLLTTGGTVSGTLILDGSPSLKLPSGTSGEVLTSDSSGNLTLQPASAPVTSVNTQTGAVVLTAADVGADASGAAAGAQSAAESFATSAVATETSRAETAEALLAPKASPALTGTPTAPTATALTDSAQVATTAYADSAVGVERTRAEAAEVLLAPLASATLTGSPTAPTKTALTSNTDIATTAYADAAVAAETSRAETAEAGKLAAANNLSELTSTASTARTNLGLGTAATASTAAFDAAGAASSAQSTAESFATSAVATETTRAQAAEVAISSLREFPVALYSGADPTGATDSTTAVQAAQAAAVAAGGGIVSFGTGTWMFQAVTVAGVTTGYKYTQPPLVHFRFAGPGATVLTPLNASQPLFQVQSGHYSAGVRMLGGFTVKAHASGSTGPAIDLTSARQWVIESPSYLDSLEGAAGTPGTYNSVIGFGTDTYSCRIVDPVCEGQRLGNCFIGTENVATVVTNANAIENPLVENCAANYIIDAAGTLSLSVTDGIIEGNTVTAAIRLGKHTVVSHSYFEANGTTYAMDAAGVDNPTEGYDPGGCLLSMNEYYDSPDVLTIPAGVTPGTMVVGTLNNLSITDNTNSLLLNFQQATAPTTLLNSAAGGTNTTTVTTGNSGGASGSAFSGVTASGVTFSNTETYAPSALSYELASSASDAGMYWSLPSSITAGETIYTRTYIYFSGSVFNTYIMNTVGLNYKCGLTSGHIYIQSYPGSSVNIYSPSANTWYRIEMEVEFGGGSATVNVYDQYGNLLGTGTGTGGTQGSTTTVYYGPYATSTTGTVYLANLGLTNGTWLGPAIAGVASVTAGDSSITVAGTQQAPTVASVAAQYAQRIFAI